MSIFGILNKIQIDFRAGCFRSEWFENCMENLLLDQETKDRAGITRLNQTNMEYQWALVMGAVFKSRTKSNISHFLSVAEFPPVGFLRARAGGDGFSFTPHSWILSTVSSECKIKHGSGYFGLVTCCNHKHSPRLPSSYWVLWSSEYWHRAICSRHWDPVYSCSCSS